MPSDSTTPATTTPTLEPGFPADRWYRVEYAVTLPQYDAEGNFTGHAPALRPDGAPRTARCVVFGLHKVARIANRISVNRMIRKLEEVPAETIAQAVAAHEEQQRLREIERLRERANALEGNHEDSTPDPEPVHEEA